MGLYTIHFNFYIVHLHLHTLSLGQMAMTISDKKKLASQFVKFIKNCLYQGNMVIDSESILNTINNIDKEKIYTIHLNQIIYGAL